MNETYLRYIGWIFIGFVAITATSCQITNLEIRQSIQAGADPMEASCAINSFVDNTLCTTAMLRKQK